MNAHNRAILVIDDDARNIFALSAVLRSRGFDCITASGVTEGLDILSRSKIDIVLMDMMMPEIDGYDGINHIRKITDIPIIAVTAQAMAGDMEKCLEAGADNYISKPIDIDKLMSILNNF